MDLKMMHSIVHVLSGPRSYRCVAVHTAHTVEINRRQTLIRQAVVKAASWTVAPFLVCVVQRHLKHIHVHELFHPIDTNTHITVTSVLSTLAGCKACLRSSEIMGMKTNVVIYNEM